MSLWAEYKVAYRDCVDWACRWLLPLRWFVRVYDHTKELRKESREGFLRY